MSRLATSAAVGTALQILMVVIGHYAPVLQQNGLFPIAGTLIGILTGWLAAPGAALGSTVSRGAVAGGVAGVIGSLVSSALGDVPFSNVAVAGGSTLIAGGLGALVRQKLLGARAGTPRSD
jgi:hypothetical protein